ncbi:MAG: hypothetical protein ACK5NL_16515 [Vibrio fluvialis]
MTHPNLQGPVPGYAPPPAPAPAPAPARRSRDTLGIVGAIVGLVPSLLSVLTTLIQPFMFASDSYREYAAIAFTVTLLAGAAGLVALALGIVAAVRRRSDRLWAGIAIGTGTVAVLGLVTNLLLYVTTAVADAF